jgi:16S rRNA processing protein RimM
VARVAAAHGLHGELVCTILTDFPERFAETDEVLVGEPRARRVEGHRLQGGRLVLKLAGVDDRTTAEKLSGALVQVPIERAVKLPPGSYFWHEIIGLRVEDQQGKSLGTVADIFPTGSNDVYVVRSAEREILLPAIKDVVREIDPHRGVMIVNLIPGLI